MTAPKSPSEYTRAIAENEPARLSAAVHHARSTDAAALLAAERATTPDRLVRQLRGDLETILGKALKKDPAERYASVAEFADDLRRHVEHQPISARPDAIGYRTAKFVRRHWRGVTAAAVTATVLATLVGFYTAQLATERDRARLEAAKASQVSELLTGVLLSADPYRTPGDAEPTVRNLLDDGAARIASELGDQPELQAEMFNVIGRTYERLGLYEKALPLLEQALAIGRRDARHRKPAGRAEPQQSRRGSSTSSATWPPPSRCWTRAWPFDGGCSGPTTTTSRSRSSTWRGC